MSFEVTMPQMGADMTEGTIVKWLKSVGDNVTRGEMIAEIETDKANVELEAFESGTLLKVIAEEGEVVPVGEVIAVLGAPNEATPDIDRKPPAVTPARREIEPEVKAASHAPAAAPAETTVSAVAEQPHAGGAPEDGRIRISPVARKIAGDAGFDYSNLQGTGPDGRILRRDVEAAIAKAPASSPATTPRTRIPP
ncbi:MAG TPA: E3 binding domain-containing protein [Tepidiformaceae bacterium]|nr:E3 binding domain-containing protein [Tepidiformaceae bacterium]